MYESKTTPATPPATGDMRTLIDTLTALGKPQKNPDADGMSYVVVPETFEVKALPVELVPARPRGTVKLRDAASFIRYFGSHRVARSTIYASLEPASFLAVFDDYGHSEGYDGTVSEQTDWRGFRALFEVPASREWRLWTAADRKHMTQLAFAEFLQDNLPDVAQPDGAELLEMALNFEAAQSGSFVAVQRLHDGSHNLQWKANNNDSGSVRLPEHITLRIPVFENEEARAIMARLRYRVTEGKLAIWIELVRPHKVLEEAFRATWQRIEAEAVTQVLLGSPE